MLAFVIIASLQVFFTRAFFQQLSVSQSPMALFAANELPESDLSDLSSFTQELNTLPISKQRAACSIVGAAVADAAIRPFHWVYNRTVLDGVVGEKEDIEFWTNSISPFYTLPTGCRSCYNDLGVAMLRALPDSALYSEEKFIDSMLDMFSDTSEYAAALQRRKEAYDPSKRLEDREPVSGPWQQGAVTNFLNDMKSVGRPLGSPESKETDGLCCSLPLIARCAARDDVDDKVMIQEVNKAARLLSSNPVALAHTHSSAAMLSKIVRGGAGAIDMDSFRSTVHQISSLSIETSELGFHDILKELDEVEKAMNDDFVETVARFGKACANPGSFMGATLGVLQSIKTDNAYTNGVRKVIKSGGCNCSKGNFLGACLGAGYGIYTDLPAVSVQHALGSKAGVPLSWMLKTHNIQEICRLALKAVK